MAKLEFPWELYVHNIHRLKTIEGRQQYSVTFFQEDGKLQHGIENLVKVKNSKITILNLTIPGNELEINIEAKYTSPIPHIKNLNNAFSLFANSTFRIIPEDLFKYNPEISSFQYCFQYCRKLKSVPQKLFTYSDHIADYYSVFSYCTSLTSIPEQLFPKNIDNQNQYFGYCFESCIQLEEVPDKLFKYVNNNQLGYAFRDCKNLKKIHSNLFSDEVDLNTNYFNRIFSDCPNLKEIPNELLCKML